MYTVKAKQFVALSPQEAWDFFSKPANLKLLTPPEMNMRMTNEEELDMYPGMVISYKVAPLLGISLPWTSEITQVKKGEYFIDSMIEGPFKIWHHQHFFKAVEGGTEITDIVNYQVPLGPIGKLFHPLIVKNKVAGIFEYRNKRIKEIFSSTH